MSYEKKTEFTRIRGDMKITNRYVKPSLKINQKIKLATFEIDNNIRKRGMHIVEAVVYKIYPHHVIFDIQNDKISLTWYDIWRGITIANKSLEG